MRHPDSLADQYWPPDDDGPTGESPDWETTWPDDNMEYGWGETTTDPLGDILAWKATMEKLAYYSSVSAPEVEKMLKDALAAFKESKL